MIEADGIGPVQDAARVIEAVDHPGVDVLGAADAFIERERRFVDHLADDPPQHEAGRVRHPGGVLAESGEKSFRGDRRGLGRIRASREFDQPRLLERREHVEADRVAAQVQCRQRSRGAAHQPRSALKRLLGLFPAGAVDYQGRYGPGLGRAFDLPAGIGRGLGKLRRQGQIPHDHYQAVGSARRTGLGIGWAVGVARIVVVAASRLASMASGGHVSRGDR